MPSPISLDSESNGNLRKFLACPISNLIFLLGALLLGMNSPSSVALGVGYGALDLSFGTEGRVVWDFGGGDGEAFGVAEQKDGRLIVVGSGRESPQHLQNFAIARFLANGELDPSFGNGGRVSVFFNDYFGSVAKAVAIQSDQKIVVVGYGRNQDYAHDTFALARLHPDGRLDASFGKTGSGKVLTPIHPQPGAGVNDMAHALLIAPDGKIIVGGVTGSFLSDFALARYDKNGNLDSSFGKQGIVVTDIGGHDTAHALALQEDGKILLAGSGWSAGSHENFSLVRYLYDGSMDVSFGYQGMVTTDFGGGSDRAQTIAVRSDGKIVVAGIGQVSGGCFPSPCERYGVALAQYMGDGSLDPNFGQEGGVLYDFLASSGVYAMVQKSDGQLLLAGHYGNEQILVISLLANGDFDEAFRGTGTVAVDLGFGADRGQAIALLRDGRALVAGRAALDQLKSGFALVKIGATP